MRAIVTCGPSYVPIDQVRRITNFSSGALGSILCDALSGAGHEVICLRGRASTHPILPAAARIIPFTTNPDLLARLKSVASEAETDAVFHAAALADFEVASIAGAEPSAKIPSSAQELHLTLTPAPKIISQLRALFPSARLVGWKYELVGSREEAIARAISQIATNHTDACVVNGRAYGRGFGLVEREALTAHFPTKHALCAGLVEWLALSRW
jgi:phosphopantothenoylcysteine synthetase/decarboxylase